MNITPYPFFERAQEDSNRVADGSRFLLRLFATENVADELTGGGVQRTITAVLIDKGTQFVGEGEIQAVGYGVVLAGRSQISVTSDTRLLSIYAISA